MDDLISRQAMQDLLDRVSAMHPYRQIGNWESYGTYNEAWTDAINMVDAELASLPSAQHRDNDYSYMGDPWEYFANTKDGDLSETEKQIKFIMWFGYAKGKKAMKEKQLDTDALINAFRQKWNDEHPVYEDTSGGMTYSEIIDFIKAFAKNDSNAK